MTRQKIFTQSANDLRLRCFYFVAITNNAPLYTNKHVLVTRVCISVVYVPRHGTAPAEYLQVFDCGRHCQFFKAIVSVCIITSRDESYFFTLGVNRTTNVLDWEIRYTTLALASCKHP